MKYHSPPVGTFTHPEEGPSPPYGTSTHSTESALAMDKTPSLCSVCFLPAAHVAYFEGNQSSAGSTWAHLSRLSLTLMTFLTVSLLA